MTRVVADPGAEVVVGTDLAGTIVVLKVQEKDQVRRGQSDVDSSPRILESRRTRGSFS